MWIAFWFKCCQHWCTVARLHHPFTLSWHQTNQSWFYLLNAESLARKQPVPILKSYVWTGLEPATYRRTLRPLSLPAGQSKRKQVEHFVWSVLSAEMCQFNKQPPSWWITYRLLTVTVYHKDTKQPQYHACLKQNTPIVESAYSIIIK